MTRRGSALHPYSAAEVLALAPFAWWKAGDLALADGAAVASWADASGNGRTATQATGSKKPTYVAAGINGLPAVLFSAANVSALQTANFTAIATPTTQIVVCKAPTTTPAATMYLLGGSANTQRRDVFYTSGRVFGQQGDAGNTGTTTAPAGVPSIVSAVFDTADSQVRTDSIPKAGASTGAQTPIAIVVGARNGQTASFDGWIGEVLYFNRRLTPAQITRIEKYLSLKWGIPLTPPGVVYVNGTTGSDTANTGRSSTSPVATATKASALLGTTAGRMELAGTLREQWAYTGTVNRLVLADGATWYGSEGHTSGWTDLGGGIYSKAVTGYASTLTHLRVVSDLDSDGFWTTLNANTATPTTPAAGEFGFDGTTIYVHLAGGADPNTKTIEAAKYDYALFTSGTGEVTVKGGTFYMGNRAGLACGSAGTDGKLVAVDVTAAYGGDLGCFATRTDATYLRATRCVGKRALNDGFNIHGSTGRNVEATLVDCEGAYNGDEGASYHDDTVGTITRGRYHHQVGGGGCTHVNNAHVDHIGVQADHNRTGSVAVVDQGGISLYDSTNGGSIVDCVTTDNNGPGVFVNPAAVGVAVSNLTSSGNAFADTLP